MYLKKKLNKWHKSINLTHFSKDYFIDNSYKIHKKTKNIYEFSMIHRKFLGQISRSSEFLETNHPR